MNLVRDIRVTGRFLLKSPRYTAAITFILTVTLGTNTAIFSAVYGILLKPLPMQDPERLVVIWDTAPARSLPVIELSYRTVEHWSRYNNSFASVAGIGSSTWPAILRGRGTPVRIASSGVSASFFKTLGASPALGRALLPSDDVRNAEAVAVLSHAAWVQYFGADPSVIGSIVDVDTKRTIVGVMPPEFDFPRGTSYWFPVVPLLSGVSGADGLASVGVLFAVARLRPGATASTAAADLDRLAASRGVPAPQRFGSAVGITGFADYILGPIGEGLWVLWAAGVLLLLIACANISGLMLNRAAACSHEHAIRGALGATRATLARRWFLEAAMLAVAGGVAGIATASWIARVIVALAPPDVPRLGNVGINPTVALFSAGVVVLCTGACSAIPAQRAAVQRAAEWLNASHSTSSLRQLRGRYALLAVQIALSIVLLISAGLVVRSFGALRRFDLGFVPSNVVTMFAGPLTNQQMDVLLARLTQRKEIEAAGAVYLRPFELGPIGQETTATLEGQAEQAARQNPTLNFQAATPGYFSATRIRLLRGRFFSLDDRSDAQPVALVGATAARRLWPREDPIGRRILLRDERGWRTVVGVVADVPYRGLGDARLDVYEPALQSSSTPNYIAVRTGADPVTVATLVRNELPQIAPRAIVDSVATLDGMVARVIAPWRFTAWLLSALGAVAVLLTTVGLIGSVSLEVTNRRRELALRLALGAQRRDVLHSAARPAAWSSGLGILIGILLAIATARAMRSLLFQIEPLDPATWAAVVGLVIAAVGIATYLPARRAAAFNPVVLLRE